MLHIGESRQDLCYLVAIWDVVIFEWQFSQERPNASSQEAHICNGVVICVGYGLPAVNSSNSGVLIDAIGSNETIAP
jgi:hypothetical protein